MDAQQIIDELVFRSYKINRINRPDITPDQWNAVYDTEKLEPRFQAEAKGDEHDN